MVKEAEILKLITKREQQKKSISLIKQYVDDNSSTPVSDELVAKMTVRKERLEECFNKYLDLHVEVLCGKQNDSEDSEVVENKYYDTLSAINKILSKQEHQSLVNKSTTVNQNISTTKLPHIEIPLFDGKHLNEFKPFYDMFLAVIDKNGTLKDVEKLFYLRSYLKGEALNLVSTLPIVNESYKNALEILKNRYDNEVMLINSHIYALLDTISMQKGNSVSLREFVGKVKQHVGALKNLGQPVDSWDLILICILSKKLDQYTHRAYQIDRDLTKLPTLREFLLFLENRAVALETVPTPNKEVLPKEKFRVTHLAIKNTKTTNKCSFCLVNGHKVFNCLKFKNISVNERISFINKQKFCNICLNNHAGKCKLSFKCQICHKNHNSLLHVDKVECTDTVQVSQTEDDEVASIEVKACAVKNNFDNVVLPTVAIKVKKGDDSWMIAHALLDSGSQSSFISAHLLKQLKLKPFIKRLNIIGISENVTKIQNCVNVTMQSCIHNYEVDVDCAVLESISNELPQFKFNELPKETLKNIKLADWEYNKPKSIDLLLGANLYFEALLPGIIKLNNNLVLQNTLFGYVLSGALSSRKCTNVSLISMHSTTTNVENLMSQFWDTEKVPEIFREYSDEQEACELIFKQSVKLINNKFEVDLPLKQDLNNLKLGDSFSVALKRFENLEKRMSKDSHLNQSYKDFINEYINLGHAKIVKPTDYNLDCEPVYFMAHHPVVREDKRTTKVRVVFDGSMKTKNKISINDYIYNGAVVQKELFDVLILFRTFEYVLLTDIKQMYRMIWLNPKHRPLQNIIWRENPNLSISCLQLQTVTYGMKSSPFLATRCLVELAETRGSEFPLAKEVLLNNTYVDDIIAGGSTILETIQLKHELINLLKLASFQLHKWCSNHSKILDDIPLENQHFDEINMSKHNPIVKTLGLSYDTNLDTLKISSPIHDLSQCVTKRQVLSFICKFYDPLGLIGPILVTAKMIMQKLWVHELQWDDILPEELQKIWNEFVQNLRNMQPLNIPRNVRIVGSKVIELVGFCDSSMVAYGAVLYIRAIYADKVHVNLLCSKSRIAPIDKKLTIPKLELNSALLLANLTNKIYKLIGSKLNRVVLYSDSKIVLAWTKTSCIKLNPYVANRMSKIQKLTSTFSWRYINTMDNPADCLSRGVQPQQIHSNDLWFHGPNFLADLKFEHNVIEPVNSAVVLSEPEVQVLKVIAEPLSNSFFTDFSCITNLQRIVAHILRFKHNIKNRNKRVGMLTLDELEDSLQTIIRYEQNSHFKEEIKCLKEHKEIKTKLKHIAPFLDKMRILRVGGRLHNACIPYDQKHPIILPKNNHITNLIITREHLKLLHAGQKHVLSSLQLTYWVINGNREIKKIIHKCVTCFKLKAKCSEQLMGTLPKCRITLIRPFQTIGIDFCGPFNIKQSRIRKSITTKSYIALFICFAVKAIHMELVSDLTTENFLNAFKRFIYRRGKPTLVHCDNGSTFKGAHNKLQEIYKIANTMTDKNIIDKFCSNEKIKFKFIPSYSPVFGGLWEAGVKSAKYHIKRVMGDSQLTYEQFNTLIIQVEGILNSRPITNVSNDPSDLTYLSPGHFLIGAPLTSFPETDCTNIPENKLKFWNLVTQKKQQFWKRWQKEYLTMLNNRPKWCHSLPNVKEGTLVLLKEDNVPCQKWPMARIVKVISGNDGKVRVVKVRTQTSESLRCINKIAVLPIYNDV